MRFGEAHWLWLLLAAPALAGFLIWALRRRERDLARWCHPGLWHRLFPERNRFAPWWKGGLVVLAVFFLVLMAARPQLGSRILSVQRKGVDVMVALDCSKSMEAEDLPPDRITRARQEIETLISHLRGDRIGLVAFAGEAFVQCPLTLDYAAARMFLRYLNTDLIPVPGTAIAEAIRTATKGFDPKERKFKALVLITDGEDHEGNVDQAVKEAKEQGVRIYAIGIGTSKGEPIPERDASGNVHDYKRDREGNVIMTRLDPTSLRRISEETGGSYFDGAAGDLAIDRLYSEISGLDQKDQKGGLATQYEDRYGYFAGAAFVLLAVESILGERRRRRAGRSGGAGAVKASDGGGEAGTKDARSGERTAARVARSAVAVLLPALLTAALVSTARAGDRGGSEYRKGHYQEARDAYEAYTREHPADPRGSYDLGTALHQTGEMQPAEQALQQALRSPDPKLREAAFYNLGNTRARARDFAGARDAYEMALRIQPQDKDAKYNLELVKALQQQQPPDSSRKQQNQQNQKNQDQKNQKQDQNQKNQDQKNQDQKNQDQSQNQQQNQQKQDQPQQQQNQQQQQQQQDQQQQQAQQSQGQDQKEQDAARQGEPLKISPEQARQILDGLAQQEQLLQAERLKARSHPVNVDKDW